MKVSALHKARHQTFSSRSCRPSCSVEVVLQRAWEVHHDDVLHHAGVQPSRAQISTDHNFALAFYKGVEALCSTIRGHRTMVTRHTVTPRGQEEAGGSTRVDGVDKDHRRHLDVALGNVAFSMPKR